ncbi:GDSL-type esterase/lipase family protein [Kineosporia sp. R_H_3]|uniref:GDSL-type esterase/lipase family protein n=1 Tax=Kineosporia sp. R_H_3 TaxID=1961848 RepID=UPI00130461AE|nr:GDSL-type esterase/lipase family protein [Kineosporia sp. R_H_3]
MQVSAQVVVLAAVALVAGLVGWADAGAPDGHASGAPSGARSTGPTGGRTPWHVVGIGDSVTSGHGCACDLVADYARLTAAATHRTVTSANLGVDGQTSAGLLEALADGGPEAGEVARADVVLVTIGANDLAGGLARWQGGACTGEACFSEAVAGVRQRVEQVVARVRALRAGRPTLVLVTDYWNVFEDGTRAVRDHGRDYLDLARTATDAADAAICAGARAGGATCVDLVGPFRAADGGVDDLLQDDGDHPDGDGHALIARTLAAAGWDALLR